MPVSSEVVSDRLSKPGRIASVDILRGLVMVLMAVDHVRVYSGVPPGGPELGIFLTRWVTHFCAPLFAFLAGTGAYLHGLKLGDTGKLSRYLATRGLLLVLLEITLIRFTWTFSFEGYFLLAGVIWMLGWCMVLMALLVRLSPTTIGAVGVCIILFQQAFRLATVGWPESWQTGIGPFWELIYPSGLPGFENVTVLYSIVPWIGVMAAGYGFGLIVTMEPERRRRWYLRLGLGMTALFLLIGTVMIAFSPAPDDALPPVLRLLNQNKYPASQLFLLMTLGPGIAFLAAAERARGRAADALATIGRVPMFYYLLHIPLIHLVALLVNRLRTGDAHPEWYVNAPYVWIPEEQRWSLGLLYLVFALVVAALYVACRWYARYKAVHPEKKWLKYL